MQIDIYVKKDSCSKHVKKQPMDTHGAVDSCQENFVRGPRSGGHAPDIAPPAVHKKMACFD